MRDSYLSSNINIFNSIIRSCHVFILSFFKKKRYGYSFDHSKNSVLVIRNTLVNTYLSLSIDNKIVYSKSTGMLGYKKKQRRIKAASYKLGKDVSTVLKNLISSNKINTFSICLMGYARYYRAIVSSIRKAIKNGVKTKIVDTHTYQLKNKLRLWKLKKKLIHSVLKQNLKLPKSYLIYEKNLESQLKKNMGFSFFKKKIYDKTSVSHGLLRPMKNYYNNRYW